jgi:hypothetical protein
MMHYIFGKFQIDVVAWKKAIEQDRAAHEEAGIHFRQVWKNVDRPDQIFFLFEADDLQRARSFLQKAGALDAEKQAKGEIPELIFLEPA